MLQKNVCHQFALDFRYLLENDAKFHSNCTVFYCICIMIIYCLISIFELSQLKVEETFKFGEFFKQWVLLPLHMFQQQHNTLGPSARPLLRCTPQ